MESDGAKKIQTAILEELGKENGQDTGHEQKDTSLEKISEPFKEDLPEQKSEAGQLADLGAESTQAIQIILNNESGRDDDLQTLMDIKNQHIQRATEISSGQSREAVLAPLTEQINALHEAYKNAVPPDSKIIKTLEDFLADLRRDQGEKGDETGVALGEGEIDAALSGLEIKDEPAADASESFGNRVAAAEKSAVAHGTRMEEANVAPLDEVVTSKYGKSLMDMLGSGAFPDPTMAPEKVIEAIHPIVWKKAK